MEYISFDDFKKLDIRVGTVKEVSVVPETDKLLSFQIDFGEKDEEGNNKLRQIVSGLREDYPDYEKLINKQFLYIINLEPRKIKGFNSEGMLLAINDSTGQPIFLVPESEVPSGARVH